MQHRLDLLALGHLGLERPDALLELGFGRRSDKSSGHDEAGRRRYWPWPAAGLSLCKAVGGHLKIYSEVGERMTVKLHLPRSFGEKIVQPEPATVLAVTGIETVLVVDDDQIVRATIPENRWLGLGRSAASQRNGRLDTIVCGMINPSSRRK